MGREYEFDKLGNSEALYEKNKGKHFDGKKIRGISTNNRLVDMVSQQMQQEADDSENYNKGGRNRHELVPFNDAQHKR